MILLILILLSTINNSISFSSVNFSNGGSATGAAERPANNGKSPSPSSQWSSQEIRGTVGGGGAMPWQCVPDRVYPVSGYGPPKNINQQAYQNRSNNNINCNNNNNNNNNQEITAVKSPPAVDSNRNSSTTATDDAKNTAVGQLQSIKSSKSFESGVLGQHANTPNGIIPWPGDHRKPRSSQWEQHHNNAVYNNGSSSPYNNGSSSLYNNGSSSPYNNGSPSLHNGPELFLGNRSSGVRSSSRGPTYFSPQHNHVSTLLYYAFSYLSIFFPDIALSSLFSFMILDHVLQILLFRISQSILLLFHSILHLD